MRPTPDKMSAFIAQLRKKMNLKSVVVTLAAIVVFTTTYLLILPAFTLDKEEAAEQGGIDVAVEQTVDEEAPAEKAEEPAAEQKESAEVVKEAEEPAAKEEVKEETASSKQKDSDVKEEKKEEKDEVKLLSKKKELTAEKEKTDDFTISAVVDKDAEVPEDVFLQAAELTKDTEDFDYDKYYNDALKALKKDSDDVKGIKTIKFYDISLEAESQDESVEPKAAVNVKIAYEDGLKVNDADNIRIVHFAEQKDGEVKAEVLDSKENKVETTVNKKSEMTEASFDTEGFSTFALAEVTLNTSVISSSDDEAFNIEVTYGPEAGIPEGAELKAEEFAEGSKEYKDYLKQSKEALSTDEMIAEISSARSFDISIEKDGEKIQPKAPVSVKIEYANPIKVDEDESIQIVHFAESGTEVIEADRVGENSKSEAVEVEFETKSFSVYSVVSSGWTQDLDGGLFAIIDTYTNNAMQAARHASYPDTRLEALAVTVDTSSDPDKVSANGSISMWKFTHVEGQNANRYYISDESGNNYLHIEDGVVTLSTTPQILRVRTEDSRAGQVRITDNNNNDNAHAVNNYAGSVDGGFGEYADSGNNEWFTLFSLDEIEDSPSGGGSIEIDDIGTPDHSKVLYPNKDSDGVENGTYTLALNVKGKANKASGGGANVIIILDISGSMQYYMDRDSTARNRDDSRMYIAVNALNTLVRTLIGDGSHNVNVAVQVFEQQGHWINNNGTNRNNPLWQNSVFTLDPATLYDRMVNATNWDSPLAMANSVTPPNDNPTHVIFITDGCPNTYGGTGTGRDLSGSEGGAAGVSDPSNPRITWPVDTATRMKNKGWFLYGVYAGPDHHGMLEHLVRESHADGSYNATSQSELEEHFGNIAAKINASISFKDVVITDGITQATSSTVLQQGAAADDYTYFITKDNSGYGVTLDSSGKISEIYPAQLNSDGTVTKGAAVNYARLEDDKENVLELRVGDPFPAAESNNGVVTWDIADLGTLLNDYTYTVRFVVWPSQEAYDLVAGLNNGTVEWMYPGATIDGDPVDWDHIARTGSGTEADPYVYGLRTNTDAKVDYTKVTVTQKEGEEPVTVKEPGTVAYTPPTPMPLKTSRMSVEKKFAHSINDQDPYAKLNFYIKRGDEYINTHGEPTVAFDEDKVYTIELPKNDGTWADSIFIAPGLIETDDNGDAILPPLETGYDYTVEEKILAGSEYEYEFTPQTVRPMVIGSKLTFLVLEDDYNAPGKNGVSADATEYTIDDKKYFVASEGTGSLIGTNRKTGELDITKIISDPDNMMPDSQEDKESFTYRVTLSIPDGTDPAGIVGYEYVVRDKATQTNAYRVFGYHRFTGQEGDVGPAATAFDEDQERLGDNWYRAWNTLVYRDLVQWENIGTQSNPRIISVRDSEGNIIWKVPAATVDGHGDALYHTITYDMTLKQDEVIRFTNLPTGTLYTIQEIYANKYPADNVGGETAGRAPVADPSNIEDQGYEIFGVKYTGGELNPAKDTVTGAIEERDTRYYNQFTNKVVAPRAVKVKLLKIGDDDFETPLDDVSFKLYNNSDCADSHQIKKDALDQQIGDANGVITTANGGMADIGALAQGTYYLKEVTAAEGYNELTDTITVKVNDDGSVTYSQLSYAKSINGPDLVYQNNVGGNYEYYSKIRGDGDDDPYKNDSDYTFVGYRIVVNNTSGTPLPLTGGIGTTIFYIFGSILAIGCGIVLIARRRAGISR